MINLFKKNLRKNIFFLQSPSSKTITFYQKPSYDILKPLNDDMEFKNLFSAPYEIFKNNEKILQNNSAFTSVSILNSLRPTKISELKDDLKSIINMIKGSVNFMKIRFFFNYFFNLDSR